MSIENQDFNANLANSTIKWLRTSFPQNTKIIRAEVEGVIAPVGIYLVTDEFDAIITTETIHIKERGRGSVMVNYKNPWKLDPNSLCV